jgi:heme ABC exporter ATP-binding subunit CcmA
VLEGVAQRLGRSWALRGIDLEIPAGELVAVVGHNGSGKTTMLRVISTTLSATRGEGRVFGFDLKRAANDVRASSIMLTHQSGLYSDLSAAENLEFAQRMNGLKPDSLAIDAALERVGLLHVRDERVRTYSSGMQRRASLARLFVRPARLVLLDEPYNSLDPQGGKLIDEILLEVRARGGAAMVVLHDLDRSGVNFDRVVELSRGRVSRVTVPKPTLFCERAHAGGGA